MPPPPSVVVYVSAQCPSCDRLLKTMKRLNVRARVVNVDTQRVDGLTAVPTVVSDGQVLTGTAAFEWVQAFESSLPLDAYAMVTGSGLGGLSYTDLESDETIDACPFTNF